MQFLMKFVELWACLVLILRVIMVEKRVVAKENNVLLEQMEMVVEEMTGIADENKLNDVDLNA